MISIYRADSVHIPIELYKQDNIRLNRLLRELQLCDSLSVIDGRENLVRRELYEYEAMSKELYKFNAAISEKKLKRTRKALIATSSVIVGRVIVRLTIGI